MITPIFIYHLMISNLNYLTLSDLYLNPWISLNHYLNKPIIALNKLNDSSTSSEPLLTSSSVIPLSFSLLSLSVLLFTITPFSFNSSICFLISSSSCLILGFLTLNYQSWPCCSWITFIILNLSSCSVSTNF